MSHHDRLGETLESDTLLLGGHELKGFEPDCPFLKRVKDTSLAGAAPPSSIFEEKPIDLLGTGVAHVE